MCRGKEAEAEAEGGEKSGEDGREMHRWYLWEEKCFLCEV